MNSSSLKYPQANGIAVKTVKQMLEKNDDPYLAMMMYRSTPLENGYSPSELLMRRKIRTTLPIVGDQLKPRMPNVNKLRKKEERIRDRMKRNFDKHHNARILKTLSPGDTVWIPDLERDASGTVVRQETSPRSYIVLASSPGRFFQLLNVRGRGEKTAWYSLHGC